MTTFNTLPSFVDSGWLQSRLDFPGLRIVQVGGENHYTRMHVPGAVFVAYPEFVTQRDGIPGLRADAEVLASLFSRLGIGQDSTVVAYDVTGGMDASRFVWSLMSMGHTGGAVVLDGGLGVWVQEQRPVESQTQEITPVSFMLAPNVEFEADREEVLAVIEKGGEAILLDTRTRNEYVGQTLRGPRGHLRGAVHLDWIETLMARHNPRLQPQDAIRARLAAIGITDPEREVIVYCESGHRAAQTWALLRYLGWRNVRLFDGSIAEWRVYDLPVVYGENPE